MTIDPVCLFHGKRSSEHYCLYCCLCFETLTPETCSVDENGQKWDVCVPCAVYEAQARAERAEGESIYGFGGEVGEPSARLGTPNGASGLAPADLTEGESA